MGRRLRGFDGAVVLGLVLVLSGCDAIPMGTGEYLTEDGDGEAAVRELAVQSVEMGAEASGVPGWKLYEREPGVRDCRSIYKTGNLVAYSGILYQLSKPIDESFLFDRIINRVEPEGWIVNLMESRTAKRDKARLLQARNGWLGFDVSPTLNDEGLVTEFIVDASSVCVKPDGEIIDDFRSRARRKSQDAS